jgi:hypothetical protein
VPQVTCAGSFPWTCTAGHTQCKPDQPVGVVAATKPSSA